tara:strand:- start:721 stop:903 length:183 start_codon:yes stop_codon:yes gene_type:complete
VKFQLGKLVSNVTVIKDGVDLQKRFVDVLDNHPLTYHWSEGVKEMISLKFYDEVMRDSTK